jgi:hypothetical protein
MNRMAAGALALACLEASAASPPAQLWSITPSGSYATGWSQSLAVDAAGNAFVVGRRADSTQECIVVRKYAAATGAQAWSKEVCGPVLSSGERQGIAVDAAGNVVVAGSVTGSTRVLKLEGATGNAFWDRSFATPPNPVATWALELDGAGNAVLAARAKIDGLFSTKIIKYASDDGRTLWEYATSGNEHYINALAVDRDGSVVFATLWRSLVYTWYVVKLTPQGEVRWMRGAPFGGQDSGPTDLAVDAAGDVYVSGQATGVGTGSSMPIAKLNGASGLSMWTRTFDSPGSDFVGKMRLTPEGDPVVAGTVGGLFVARLSATYGSTVWEYSVPDTATSETYAYDVIADARANILVAAQERITKDGGTTAQLHALALDRASGQLRWSVDQKAQGSYGTSNVVPTSSAIYMLDGSLDPARLTKLDATGDRPALNVQGLWWRASESGWGINFAQQGEILFVTWFTYDVDGKPLWFVMSDAHRESAMAYRGRIYRMTGPAFNAVPFSPSAVHGVDVGEGFISFVDDANGEFQYSIGGTVIRKPITRMVYASTIPTCSASTGPHAANYQDLWWAAPAGSESGWGINFTHQKDTLFATWFTYGADGQATWLAASDLTRGAGQTFSGILARATGPSYAQESFNPAGVVLKQAGTMKVTFADPEHGVLEYTVDGVSQSKPIVRLIVANPPTVCQ